MSQDVPASPSRRTTAEARPLHAETTSKLLLVASNGKVFTLEGAKLPGGRGRGEPCG